MNKSGGAIRQKRRCAIYTRKSSEEGLEQEFNSLHAQREACEAFIKSQRQEGWSCQPQPYDDGGRSGGNMERPALQQLLGDIRAGKVDVVVVYKIDRLTRSLADFAKIVEIFDAKGVSFVSVTQQFNTTTSMGRLTLNVLLSFAQFEREVTGERIRDKIAASKRKGMWMGGVPPLGYEVQNRKLAVIPEEAETVLHIFRRYVALGSVRLLKEELEAQRIASKHWTSISGRSWGGKPITRGALYLMLQNRIYRGEIVHKDQTYPGEHTAIIDQGLWAAVQARLAANAVERGSGRRVKNPSLLVGLLFDGEGNRMTPTHAVKNGTRYRYYVSHSLITRDRAATSAGLRIPAAEIEQIVTDRIRLLLTHPAEVFGLIEPQGHEVAIQKSLMARAAELASRWSELSAMRVRVILATLIRQIEVHSNAVTIEVWAARVAAVIGQPAMGLSVHWPVSQDEPILTLSVGARLQRAGKEIRMVIETTDPIAPARKADPALIKTILRAHRFHRKLMQGTAGKFAELAQGEAINRTYFTRLLRLAYLAPDITEAILDGRQPSGLTATTLIERSLPPSWAAQRCQLGFG